MKDVRHAFLIRPPEEVAASFQEKWSEMRAEDIGFRRQAELFDHVCQLFGEAPPVLLARDVLTAPGEMLQLLCARLGVSFDPKMLTWDPGGRSTDGIWASHWYAAVNRSTGFAPPREAVEVPEVLVPLINACRPFYEKVLAHKLRSEDIPPSKHA